MFWFCHITSFPPITPLVILYCFLKDSIDIKKEIACVIFWQNDGIIPCVTLSFQEARV